MRRHLKNYFIPHEGNEHQPHFLRDTSIGILVAVICIASAFSWLLTVPFVANKLSYIASILPSVLVMETNESRTEVGQNALIPSDVLTYAAQLKANDMAEKGYFAHMSPDGKTPWYWIQLAGYTYVDAGENLAVNFVDSDEVHNAWMESPGHRANILRDGFTEIGIATASGKYKGRDAIFVAQYFGKPRVVAIEVKNIVPAQTAITPQKVQFETVVNVDSGISTTSPQVLGEQQLSTTTIVSSIHKPTWFERTAASPRTAIFWFLGIVAAIVAISLVLKVTINRHIQFPKLILNGVLALAIILVLMGVSEMMGGLMSGVI